MARQVLPITGSIVTGYAGKLSWWRRALFWLATRRLRRGPAVNSTFLCSTPVMGRAVDPATGFGDG